MKVHYLQHVPFEGLGSMEDYFRDKGHELSSTALYAGDALPPVDTMDWLIVMGGPMGIDDHDEYPWLRAEREFIRRAIEAGKNVLGICLGAQLIAEAMGARVTGNAHREIGWFPIVRSREALNTILGPVLPEQSDAFHWHGDTFDLPWGAIPIASSEACRNQAFAVDNRIFGFQFHLETTAVTARSLIEHCRDELDGSSYVQSEEEMMENEDRFDRINETMYSVLEAIEQHHNE